MSGERIPVLSITIMAVGAIQAQRFVNYQNQAAGDGDVVKGVSFMSGTDEPITIDSMGLTTIESGGVVTEGELVQSDATSRAIDRTTGAIAGRALDSATQAGQPVRILQILS